MAISYQKNFFSYNNFHIYKYAKKGNCIYFFIFLICKKITVEKMDRTPPRRQPPRVPSAPRKRKQESIFDDKADEGYYNICKVLFPEEGGKSFCIR